MKNSLTTPWVAACSWIEGNIRRVLIAGAALLVVSISSTVSSDQPGRIDPTASDAAVITETTAAVARFANFGLELPSPEARHIADWAADSGDPKGAGFVIVDKKSAKVYVFDHDARLLGASPVLLGAARGDDAVPGIGTRPIAQVRPEERTTHAGRFIGERGRNNQGEDIVWVDYDAAVSMHRVRSNNKNDRRLERLATATIDDNRISYGCINIPVAFYETYIDPAFASGNAVIYVLPEVKSVSQVFGSYDVASRHGPLQDLPRNTPELTLR